jgi:hypothetical protein
VTSDRDIARLIWRAAAMAERDPTGAAEFLEKAAQCLRGKEVEEPTPAPARD